MTNFIFLTLFLLSSAAQVANATCIGIGCTCSITSTAPVAFGNYNPLSVSALDGTGSISVTCSALVAGLNVSYTIALNGGLNGTLALRNMNAGSSFLSYNLYTTAPRTIIWGDGTAGTQMVTVSYLLNLLSNTVTSTVFGQIPALQNVKAGSYTDIISITVTY